MAGTWRPGESGPELAQREGVNASTVDNWAAMAMRLLRVAPDVEAYRGANLRRLDEVYSEAREMADPKTAVAAVAEVNRMLGLHAPAKAEVSVTVQAFAALDDEAMLAKVEEQLAALQELRATLLAKRSLPALPAEEAR